MQEAYEKVTICYERIRERIPFVPKLALVLGSGLGGFAENGAVKIKAEIPYADIPDFPVSTVSGHAGRFLFAEIDGTPVVMMQGRVHYYEGYSMQDVVLPIRLMGKMGAEILILTNAAGGANREFCAGDFMMITDHIASFVPSPLIGKNDERFGTRFPDMSEVYDKRLRAKLAAAAQRLDIPLRQGVYLQLSGPAYETPAEVAMCIRLGADAIGMSTACEAVAARHMGMRVCGISLITNPACGLAPEPLSHEEVQKTAELAKQRFAVLIQAAAALFSTEE